MGPFLSVLRHFRLFDAFVKHWRLIDILNGHHHAHALAGRASLCCCSCSLSTYLPECGGCSFYHFAEVVRNLVVYSECQIYQWSDLIVQRLQIQIKRKTENDWFKMRYFKVFICVFLSELHNIS